MSSELKELQDQVAKFSRDRGWEPYHQPKDLAIGLVTEASEFLELFRFVSEKEVVEKMKDPEFRTNLGDELADTMYFVLLFAEKYGFDLKKCIEEKLKKNETRYPVDKSFGSNKKYDKLNT